MILHTVWATALRALVHLAAPRCRPQTARAALRGDGHLLLAPANGGL